MEHYLEALDDFFCENYSDYVRIAAIEGYEMPEMVSSDRNGNIYRKESEQMRLSHQSKKAELLSRLKENLADTEFTFDFSFPPFSERLKDRFRKHTFAKLLPDVLSKYSLTPGEISSRFTTEPEIFEGILSGKYYPEKNFVMGISLVCRLEMFDVNNLLAVCGFTLSPESVRDIVFEFLITQKIFNGGMIQKCLSAYKIDTLPIKFGNEEGI